MSANNGGASPLLSLKGESFLEGRVVVHGGDNRDVLRSFADNSFDSVVTDPPYALVSIIKRFGKEGSAPVIVPEGGSGAYARASSGFMGKQWDTGDTAHAIEFWQEVFRVLKPGGYVLAFAGTRTYHRLACAIEDAGFEIRDMVQWIYGSGFPKSHDVSKGIDKAAGVERGTKPDTRNGPNTKQETKGDKYSGGYDNSFVVDTGPATDAAREWQGWGTALKPACEPICMARKPLSEGTVAANVLRWGTGAINVDGCRVGAGELIPGGGNGVSHSGGIMGKQIIDGRSLVEAHNKGRFPANVITDGSDEVVGMFPTTTSGSGNKNIRNRDEHNAFGKGLGKGKGDGIGGDSGSAVRFFYTAKADTDDRLGSKHPTVKPVDLMQYLIRLVTPKGGLVLDPFAGTGTTAEAAFREGATCVLVEREIEYQADIRRRMALVMAGPGERKRQSAKAKAKAADHGPLFNSSEET